MAALLASLPRPIAGPSAAAAHARPGSQQATQAAIAR